MKYWLLKQEPSEYDYALLEGEGYTIWDGVRNNLALKNIGAMKKGDKAFFYHTGGEKQVVGIVEITSNPYPNPKEADKRFLVVDVKPLLRLKRPVLLEAIKKDSKFKNWELVRIPRLSVMPVPRDMWDEILKKSKA